MPCVNDLSLRPLLILGAKGQLGRSWAHFCKNAGIQYVAWDRSQADLNYPDQVIVKMQQLKPKWVINAAAFTNMDAAEVEPGRRANEQVNAQTPRQLASWCRDQDAVFLHYSTDAVFAGIGNTAHKETDPTQPINAYGEAKARGEQGIVEVGGKYLIFRTSWVFAEVGTNFVNAIVNLAQEQEVLRVVNDQWGAPTYAMDLVQASVASLKKTWQAPLFPSGIYHISNVGWTSRFEQAQVIVSQLQQRDLKLKVRSIEPLTSESIVQAAKRAKNSRLDISKFVETFTWPIPSWEDAIRRCLESKFYLTPKEPEVDT